MPSDRVIIPTYFRPEYLYLCLEHIAQAEGGRDLQIHVLHDHHIGESGNLSQLEADMRIVRDRFEHGVFKFIYFYDRPAHSSYGNSLCVLEGYVEALKHYPERVYMIQDDVMVAPDFFRWHLALQKRFPNCFCSSGWYNPHQLIGNDRPNAYVRSEIDYASIGVCWPHEALAEVVQHACADYYYNPIQYLATHFPNAPWPPEHWREEDGLIKRMILQPGAHRTTLWPLKARCAHIGVTGYHRTGRIFTGPLLTRVEELRTAMQTPDIAKMTNEDWGAVDIHPLPPYTPWNEADLEEHFFYEHAA
jgi:hypothetical protein